MSARVVADLLALAHRGAAAAEAARDPALAAQAMEVASRALRHPDAGTFFGALALALDEMEDFGNDPGVQENGEGVLTPDVGPEDEGDSVEDDVRRGEVDRRGREARDDSHGDAAGPVHESVVHGDAGGTGAQREDDGAKSDEGESRVTAAIRSVARVLGRRL